MSSEPKADKRPHRSPSQLEMFSKCGQQYVFRYIEKKIIPPGMAMMRGRSVHSAAESNNRQKIETHEDLPVSEIRDIAAAAFDAGLAGGYVLNEDEVSQGQANAIGQTKDRTVEAAAIYGQVVAPEYQPVLVEEKFRVVLPGTHDLLGIIDLADDKNRVVDLKTSGKKKTQDEADHSIQLTSYDIGHKVLTGVEASSLELETIVVGKTSTKRQTLSTTRGELDYRVLANRINAMNDAVQKGAVVPAPVGAWW